MAKEEFNYIDIFEYRQWERVLFLTYALSLTFFETVILRKLRNVGCQDIWIVADIDGYQMSLSERKSTHIGQEYRLVPVGLKNGVFHPKCVYLSSSEGDLLVIGSGNLTFGGYGRNLEVAEILSPDKAPKSFIDFSNILGGLRDREDFKSPDNKWISDFLTISRNAVKSETEVSINQPRLISSVNNKIVDTIIGSCKDLGKPEKIISLSPFYSNDVAAIKYLTEKTGCSSMLISLPPGNPASTTFPFDRANALKMKVAPVIPFVYKNNKKHSVEGKRKLHAKWIELHVGNKGKISVIGSINSTNQALLTLNNIELGVLHIEKNLNNWIQWEPAKLPKSFQSTEYSKPGIGERILVYANMREDGLLEGVILTNSDPQGTWNGLIVKPDGQNVKFIVQVDEKGKFKLRIPDLEEYAFSSALQISLTNGGLSGRGWIHLEDILQIPRTRRLSLTALLRMINREETRDDEMALIDYLSMSEAKHLSIFNKALKTSLVNKKEQESKDEVFYIQVDQLQPDSDIDQSLQQQTQRGYSSGNPLERILVQLRKRLLGHNIKKAGKEIRHSQNEFGDGDDPDSEHIDKERARIVYTVDDFNDNMFGIMESSDNIDIRATVLSISIEVSMHMYQRRLHDKEEAILFVKKWFLAACNNMHVGEDVNSVEQHIYAAAAILSSMFGDASIENDEGITDRFNRSMIHKLLEKYYNGDVIRDRAVSSLSEFSEVAYVSWLAGLTGDLIIENFVKTLNEKTIRYKLIEFISLLNDNKPIPPIPPGNNASWKKIYYLMEHKSKIIYKEQVRDHLSCPHCHLELPDCAAQDLIQSHLAYCDSCGKFTIRTRP